MGYEKSVLVFDQAASWHALAKGIDTSPNGHTSDALVTNEPGTHASFPDSYA